jgi:hypothetical protein
LAANRCHELSRSPENGAPVRGTKRDLFCLSFSQRWPALTLPHHTLATLLVQNVQALPARRPCCGAGRHRPARPRPAVPLVRRERLDILASRLELNLPLVRARACLWEARLTRFCSGVPSDCVGHNGGTLAQCSSLIGMWLNNFAYCCMGQPKGTVSTIAAAGISRAPFPRPCPRGRRSRATWA